MAFEVALAFFERSGKSGVRPTGNAISQRVRARNHHTTATSQEWLAETDCRDCAGRRCHNEKKAFQVASIKLEATHPGEKRDM